jgi:hypothetical protein
MNSNHRGIQAIILRVVIALTLVLPLLVTAGCIGSEQTNNAPRATDTSQQQGNQVALEDYVFEWGGYTMRLIRVADDAEATMAGTLKPAEGMKIIRVDFEYLAGGQNSGFTQSTLANTLKSSPIALRDANGTHYQVGSILTHPDYAVGASNNIGLANAYTQIGFVPSVPAGTNISDYTLVIGDIEVQLKPISGS